MTVDGTVDAENGVEIESKAELALNGAVKAGADVSIKAGADVSGAGSIDAEGKVDFEVKGDAVLGNVSAGQGVDVSTAGSLSADNIKAGTTANVSANGGDANLGGVAAGQHADIYAAGSLTAGTVDGGDVSVLAQDTTIDSLSGDDVLLETDTLEVESLEAGNVEAFVNGDMTIGEAEVKDEFLAEVDGAIESGDGTIAAGTLDITAGDDITINTAMANKEMANVATGGDLTINEKSNSGFVKLGTVSGNNVAINASTIGGADGASGGFQDANGAANNVTARGNLNMNVGGQAGQWVDALEMQVGGDLTIGSAGGIANPLANYIHMVLTVNDGKNMPKISYDDIKGLLIINNQIMGGNSKFVQAINRALGFVVNTPELKSKQGVFGEPAFVHMDMDVSEASSIGTVDFLNIGEPDVSKIFTKVTENVDELDKLTPVVTKEAFYGFDAVQEKPGIKSVE